MAKNSLSFELFNFWFYGLSMLLNFSWKQIWNRFAELKGVLCEALPCGLICNATKRFSRTELALLTFIESLT